MRRLNVKLTLWLVGITLFSVVGVHFLHGYQIDRNAEFLRIQAQTAEKNGNFKEAIKQYNQYLKYRDDPEGYSALSGLVVEIAKETDASRQDRFKAYNTLEVAVRRHPDLEDVRRRLIDYLMTKEVRRFPEALEHIHYLVENNKGDSGLEFKSALCLWKNGEESEALKILYSLVGFDEVSGQFKPEPTAGVKEVEAFELLATILDLKSDGRKQADAVMKQLVDLNPDFAKAHLSRSTYLAGNANKAAQASIATRAEANKKKLADEANALLAESKQALDRAFELAPDDIDVILAAAGFAMSNREFSNAQELLDKALRQDSKRQDVYIRLAQLEVTQNNPKAAAEHLEQGLQQANDIHGILQMLVDIQFQLNDLSGVRRTCELMKGDRGNFVPEFVRYQEARVALAEGDFTEASREFEAVRPSLNRSGFTQLIATLDFLLGRCYESLGQPDRQLEVCRRILEVIPDQLGARLGEVSALQALGRYDEARNTLRILYANVKELGYYRGTVLQFLIADQMSKPAEERGWTDVEAVAELMYEDKSRSELENTLLKSEIMMLNEQLDPVQQMLTAARKQYPKDARVWVALAKLLLRQKRTDRTAQLLNLAEKEVGDSVLLRLERSRAISRDGGDHVAAELAKLETDLDKLSEGERAALMLQLGNAYLQVRDVENAKRCWKYVADRQPSNGQIRQTLFELAFDSKDLAEMQALTKSIGGSRYFGTQSPLYNYCSAIVLLYPLISQNRTGQALSMADRALIADARRVLDAAIAVRGEWSVLWRVRAEISQLEGNIPDAIANYQRSLSFSRIGQGSTARRLVQLLYLSRRYVEADDALKFVGPIGPNDPLSKIKEDIQVRGGKQEDVDAALATAETAAKAEPDKASNWKWLAVLLDRVGRADDAEAAYRKAVEVGPKQPDTWDALVRHLMLTKKKADAVDAARLASAALPEHPSAVAFLFERVDDQAQAEHYYKAAHEEHPDELLGLRNLAEYYIRRGRARDANAYLDQIIKKTAQSSNNADLAQLFWARRYRAQNLAAPHTAQEPPDYEQVMQATKLIEQNARDGVLPPEDIRAMVALLANRAEPESRAKAIRLLEQLKQRSLITAREELAVGQLLDRAGNWTRARDWIFSALSRSPEDPEILAALAQLLIRHEENEEASRWVDRLDEVLAKTQIPRSDVVKANAREIKARILIKKGEPEQAVQVLEGLVPTPLPQNQLFLLEKVANLLEELKQFAAAEKLLNDYMSQEPRGTIALAAFLGRRGDVEKAFALLEEARKNQPAVEILPCALEALRMHPDKASKERFAMIEEWTNSGLKQESNSQQIQLLAAELYDLEGRYPEVVKIYRGLLDSPDTNAHQKAVVKNNLAFILAITSNAPGTAAESLKLTGEAMRVLGPNSDLLDTRALGYLAKGDVTSALADLRAAVLDAPLSPLSANKYFHLAEAERRAKNIDKAREALDKAQTNGLDVNRLTPLEKQNYKRLTEELK